MKWRRFIPHILLFFGGLGYTGWSFVRRPFPMLGENPLLDLDCPGFFRRHCQVNASQAETAPRYR